MPPPVRSTSVVFAAALYLLAPPGHGQENELAGAAPAAAEAAAVDKAPAAGARAPAPTVAGAAEAPEEITVTGQRSLSSLDLEIGKATERFWDLLGTVLDDPDFTVTCNREAALGTRIAGRVCRTEFQREEIRRFAHSLMRGAVYDPNAGSVEKNRELTGLIVGAINTSPELRAAVAELERLKKAYEAETKSRTNARRTRTQRSPED